MRKRGGIALLLAAAGLSPGAAQPPAPQFETLRLWPGPAPGARGDAAADIPTVTVFRPQNGRGNGTAIIIAPGGGYIGLATMLEGVEPAAWFTSRGATAFVLTYRVGAAARLPTVLGDGARAIRFVRANAARYHLDPARIGMMGFSAGGHLAASTAVGADSGRPDAADPIERVSSRPDFLILGYPWLEGTQLTAKGTSQYCDFAQRQKIPCNPADYVAFAPTARVTKDTPPAFLYHTTSDELVPVGTSVRFYEALQTKGVSAELHVFQTGPHGTGLGGTDPALSLWPELLDQWLRARKLIGPLAQATP